MAISSYVVPFGLRQVQLIPFTDLTATALDNANRVFLPASRTLSFAEAEDFEDLRGDDSLITSHGSGPSVEWELEGGGVSLEAVKLLYGGQFTATGVTPNVVKTLTKYSVHATDSFYQRPPFKVIGRAISDFGGDFQTVIYRAKSTDNLEGELADSSFWLTGASGKGYPSNVVAETFKVWDFVHRETAAVLT